METRTVYIRIPLPEGLYWHFQVGQHVTVPNSDYGAAVVDAYTEGQFSELTSEAVYGKDQGGHNTLRLCHV
jgi:hypothetical protein